MPLFRGSGSLGGGFKTPRTTTQPDAPQTDAKKAAEGDKPTMASSAPPRAGLAGQRRAVFYPDAVGKSAQTLVEERLARRTGIDYHAPEPTMARKRFEDGSGHDNSVHGDINDKAEPGAANGDGSDAAKATDGSGAPAATAVTAEEEAAKPAEEDEEDAADIIDSLPVSAHGKLYFQVETEGATKHDSTGIIIIDVDACAVQMFDRVGRQHGNRPDPGYPCKPADVESAKAGYTMKVGMKPVLLVTALREDSFRSGEFFLRTEHDKRKKEEKRKAKIAAIEAENNTKKTKITFGSGFQAAVLRRRPTSTGFVVPVAGRPKSVNGVFASELQPLHDPDRDEAVTLFKADYKRDTNGRRIVSVVVDPIIGDKLRPHQRIGVKFLYDCITGEQMPGYYGAILADEMGLGKTIQTVATIWTCLKQGKFGTPIARKVVVVAPSSLVKNWCNEFDKWLGEGAVKAMAIAESTPKGDRILSRFESEGDVLVISYDQLRKYIARLSTVKSIELVVCDEGHKLKNAEIKTTKAVDMMPTRRRIILSGTPIQNDLTEFHAMVGFVNPGMLGNLDLFKRVFEEVIMLGRDPDTDEDIKELGAERAHYLANLTQKFILRRTQTINEKYLPAKVDMTVFCRLGDEQRRIYENMSALADKLTSTPLVLITALKKLCNHADLLHAAINSGNSRDLVPKTVLPKGFAPGKLSTSLGSKMGFVSSMLDELTTNGDRDKLVIVSNYTQTLDIIANLCRKKGVNFFQLDGNTPIKKRQDLVDRFNVPIAQEIVFLLSSKAGGVGLNLVGANRLILFDPDWNPANDAQAMGRVWRDGQKKKVFIYRLLSTGTIEEKIYQRQVSKQGLSANVVDMKDDSKQHFTLEEMKALFTFRPDTLCDTHDLLECKCLEPKVAEKKDTALRGFRKVQSSKPATGGPRMDELKSWQHVNQPATFALDKVMMAMAKKESKLVSFLFANERDAKKLENMVAEERAFVADEGAITCTQEGAEDAMEIDLVHDSDSEEEDSASSDSDY